MSEESPTPTAGGQLWEVVGGEHTGGLLVRKDADLKSDEVHPRLGFGSKVKEIGKSGTRLNFVLETGDGPQTGWVTVRLERKELLRPVIVRERTVTQQNEMDFHAFKKLAAESGSMPEARFWDTVLERQILVPNLHNGNLVEVVGLQSRVHNGKVGKLQSQRTDDGSTYDGFRWVVRLQDEGKEIAVLRRHLVPWRRDPEELRRLEEQRRRREEEQRKEEERQKEEERHKEKKREIARRRSEMNKRREEEQRRKEEEAKRKEEEAKRKEEEARQQEEQDKRKQDEAGKVHRARVERRCREEEEQRRQEVQRQNAEEESRQRRVQQGRDAHRQKVARRKQQEDERQREKEQRREEMRRLERARHRQEEQHQRLEEQRKLKERRRKNEEDRQALQRLEEHRRVEAERLDVARKHAEKESKRLEQLQALRQRVEARKQEVARRRAAQEARKMGMDYPSAERKVARLNELKLAMEQTIMSEEEARRQLEEQRNLSRCQGLEASGVQVIIDETRYHITAEATRHPDTPRLEVAIEEEKYYQRFEKQQQSEEQCHREEACKDSLEPRREESSSTEERELQSEASSSEDQEHQSVQEQEEPSTDLQQEAAPRPAMAFFLPPEEQWQSGEQRCSEQEESLNLEQQQQGQDAMPREQPVIAEANPAEGPEVPVSSGTLYEDSDGDVANAFLVETQNGEDLVELPAWTLQRNTTSKAPEHIPWRARGGARAMWMNLRLSERGRQEAAAQMPRSRPRSASPEMRMDSTSQEDDEHEFTGRPRQEPLIMEVPRSEQSGAPESLPYEGILHEDSDGDVAHGFMEETSDFELVERDMSKKRGLDIDVEPPQQESEPCREREEEPQPDSSTQHYFIGSGSEPASDEERCDSGDGIDSSRDGTRIDDCFQQAQAKVQQLQDTTKLLEVQLEDVRKSKFAAAASEDFTTAHQLKMKEKEIQQKLDERLADLLKATQAAAPQSFAAAAKCSMAEPPTAQAHKQRRSVEKPSQFLSAAGRDGNACSSTFISISDDDDKRAESKTSQAATDDTGANNWAFEGLHISISDSDEDKPADVPGTNSEKVALSAAGHHQPKFIDMDDDVDDMSMEESERGSSEGAYVTPANLARGGVPLNFNIDTDGDPPQSKTASDGDFFLHIGIDDDLDDASGVKTANTEDPCPLQSMGIDEELSQAPAAQPEALELSTTWEVIGGRNQSGLIVRAGESLKSEEARPSRLGIGAVIRELELVGSRLHFQLLSGPGPESGWVSTQVHGQNVLARQQRSTAAKVQPAPKAGSTPANAKQLGPEAVYEVVYKSVLVRDAPDTDSPSKCRVKEGTNVAGTAYDVSGKQWLLLNERSRVEFRVSRDAWMLINVGNGWGELLKCIRSPHPGVAMQPSQEPAPMHVDWANFHLDKHQEADTFKMNMFADANVCADDASTSYSSVDTPDNLKNRLMEAASRGECVPADAKSWRSVFNSTAPTSSAQGSTSTMSLAERLREVDDDSADGSLDGLVSWRSPEADDSVEEGLADVGNFMDRLMEASEDATPLEVRSVSMHESTKENTSSRRFSAYERFKTASTVTSATKPTPMAARALGIAEDEHPEPYSRHGNSKLLEHSPDGRNGKSTHSQMAADSAPDGRNGKSAETHIAGDAFEKASNGKSHDCWRHGGAVATASDSTSRKTEAGNHYAKFSIRELRNQLAQRGITIPPGVAEKIEMVTLLQEADAARSKTNGGTRFPDISDRTSGSHMAAGAAAVTSGSRSGKLADTKIAGVVGTAATAPDGRNGRPSDSRRDVGDNYANLNVRELKEQLDKRGVNLSGVMEKSELLDLMRKTDKLQKREPPRAAVIGSSQGAPPAAAVPRNGPVTSPKTRPFYHKQPPKEKPWQRATPAPPMFSGVKQNQQGAEGESHGALFGKYCAEKERQGESTVITADTISQLLPGSKQASDRGAKKKVGAKGTANVNIQIEEV